MAKEKQDVEPYWSEKLLESYSLDADAESAERRMIMANCTGIRCPMQAGYRVCECDLKDCPWRTEQMTNADRIRDMTDEELAEMLWKTGRNYRAVCADPVVDHDEQYAELVKWLQHPAE